MFTNHNAKYVYEKKLKIEVERERGREIKYQQKYMDKKLARKKREKGSIQQVISDCHRFHQENVTGTFSIFQ